MLIPNIFIIYEYVFCVVKMFKVLPGSVVKLNRLTFEELVLLSSNYSFYALSQYITDIGMHIINKLNNYIIQALICEIHIYDVVF